VIQLIPKNRLLRFPIVHRFDAQLFIRNAQPNREHHYFNRLDSKPIRRDDTILAATRYQPEEDERHETK